MKTCRIPWSAIEDADDEAIEIRGREWRHGRHVTYVIALDGAHWMFEVPVHTQEGWQTDGDDVEAVQVHQVEKTIKIWEPVP